MKSIIEFPVCKLYTIFFFLNIARIDRIGGTSRVPFPRGETSGRSLEGLNRPLAVRLPFISRGLRPMLIYLPDLFRVAGANTYAF